MSVMGIDVGTTGCKAAVFSESGKLISLRYAEYLIDRPKPRCAQLNSEQVWIQIREVIRSAAAESGTLKDLKGISVTSMGENVVPVSRDRRILGPSILNIDQRGEEFLPQLRESMDDRRLHEINGNVWGNQYTLPKLMWIQKHQPELYEKTWKFLHWAAFVTFMLGSEPVVDYSLANRSLLFDISRGQWSRELLEISGIDREKLPDILPSGTQIGAVGTAQAEELGIPAGTPLVSGAHDQCANALGCGAVEQNTAMYGMGTFPTIAPVYADLPDRQVMIRNRLNIEHHAVPGRYVSFIFHMGGSAVRWYRDTLAADRKEAAGREGKSVYQLMYDEMPRQPAPVLVLPRFAPMGPPDYEEEPFGAVAGLSLETTRGGILKGILEANTMALNLLVSKLPEAGIDVDRFLAVGGGSRDDRAVQIAADIFGKPLIRSEVEEAGALGAALLAGIGAGVYQGFEEACRAAAGFGKTFEPEDKRHRQYQEVFSLFCDYRERLNELSGRWNRLQRQLRSPDA